MNIKYLFVLMFTLVWIYLLNNFIKLLNLRSDLYFYIGAVSIIILIFNFIPIINLIIKNKRKK